MIQRTFYRILDWFSDRAAGGWDEDGQYSPMGIVWAIVALIVCLAILRAFGII